MIDLDVYPWPEDGDDPFRLNSGPGTVVVRVRRKLQKACDIGVCHIEETGRGHSFLIYAIVFSYRHYMELSLKLIIRLARDLMEDPADLPATHDLDGLWNIARPLLEGLGDDGDTFRNVGACLARFNVLDATSESFRYPVSRSGDRTLEGVSEVDLGQVRDVVAPLSGFFDAADQALSVNLEAKHELLHEYAVGGLLGSAGAGRRSGCSSCRHPG